jgi:rhodanese-related sulfurtransferase
MTRKLFQSGIFFLMLVFGFSLLSAKDIPRIATDELKKLLDNPEVTILDVRTNRDWEKSDLKIKGARWEDPQMVASWANKYSPEKTLVLYCA